MNGLMLILRDSFGFEYSAKTIRLDENGKVIDEGSGFDLSMVEKSGEDPILFKIQVKGRGKIIMDMFNRPSKFNQH